MKGLHGFQLKAGHLGDDNVRILALHGDGAQRISDVAADVHRAAGGFKHTTQQCDRCGFPVGARYGDQAASLQE